MLSFIDHILRINKQVHNEYMGGLDVIMTNDFFQAPFVWDWWIFKPITNTFNTIALNYWLEYVQCYELQGVMQQNDINLLTYWIGLEMHHK